MSQLKTLFIATIMLALTGTAHAADKYITVASTTSTANSGLFDYLLPTFTKKTGIEVRVVAVGTCLLYTSPSPRDRG